jgi:hypothetical protein
MLISVKDLVVHQLNFNPDWHDLFMSKSTWWCTNLQKFAANNVSEQKFWGYKKRSGLRRVPMFSNSGKCEAIAWFLQYIYWQIEDVCLHF